MLNQKSVVYLSETKLQDIKMTNDQNDKENHGPCILFVPFV